MRLLRPSLVVFCVALVASLCIHLPVYEVLGSLANELLHAPALRAPQIVEFELPPLAPGAPPESEPLLPVARKLKEAPPPEPIAEKPKEKDALKPKPTQMVEAQPVPATQIPPPEPAERLAVKQPNDDPQETAPDDARFIAEENRKVLEETVARVRNLHRDDPEPAPSAARSPEEQEKETGNAEETQAADLQELRGSEERTPNEIEARREPTQPSQDSAGKREAEVAPLAPSTPAPASEAVAETRASGVPATGGETLVVQDETGSFLIRKAPVGTGKGTAGSDLPPGAPSPERRNRGAVRAQTGADLRLSFSEFEETFGSDALREQREAYVAQRKSRTEGQNRQQSWRKFRAAIENFVPNVAPGNQTALNTAASPFASYLSDVHRRIHRRFAHEFLQNLPIMGGPFGDRSLYTVLEIVINGDGSLHQVGVTKTSGFLPFDYGAFNAVTLAAPYSAPPRKILSGDGRVYVHWGFYRNERQCGTFNARPFILPNPKGTPAPGQGPLRDEGEDEQREQPKGMHETRDGELGRKSQVAPLRTHG